MIRSLKGAVAVVSAALMMGSAGTAFGQVTSYAVVFGESDSNTDDAKIAVAVCPDGTNVLGGGGFPIFVSGVSGIVQVIALRISTPFSMRTERGEGVNNAWLVHAFEVEPDSFSRWVLRAYAVCGDAVP